MTDSPSHQWRARTFSPSFKEAAVAHVDTGARSEALASVARSLGNARKLLYEWRDAFRAEGLAGLSRRRGRKPGWRAHPPEPMPGDPPFVTASGGSQLARAQRQIAELERLAGRFTPDFPSPLRYSSR